MSRGGVLRPGPWAAAFGLVTALLVVVPQVADPIVLRGWALLAGLAAASGLLRVVAACRTRSVMAGPGRDDSVPARPVAPPRRGHRALARAAAVLPPTERAAWRAELAAVLAYADDPAERRRQAVGFALALPATAACCWRLRLRDRTAG